MNTVTRRPMAVPRYNIFASPIGPQILLEGEGMGGGGSPPSETAEQKTAREAKEAKDAADAAIVKEKKDLEDRLAGMTDSEAKLLKEQMATKDKLRKANEDLLAAQAELKKFEGVDPAKARAAEAAAAKAEQDRKDAELAAAEKAGEVDRVKKMMADAHAVEIGKAQTDLSTAQGQLAAANKLIEDLTVGQNFSSSEYVRKELVTSPSRTRALFGSHFEQKDGVTVGFDKPKGEKDRTMLVGSDGRALGFEEAIKKIVEAQADKDTLKKGNLLPGAGSKTTDNRTTPARPADPGVTGSNRILAALEANKRR